MQIIELTVRLEPQDGTAAPEFPDDAESVPVWHVLVTEGGVRVLASAGLVAQPEVSGVIADVVRRLLAWDRAGG